MLHLGGLIPPHLIVLLSRVKMVQMILKHGFLTVEYLFLQLDDCLSELGLPLSLHEFPHRGQTVLTQNRTNMVELVQVVERRCREVAGQEGRVLQLHDGLALLPLFVLTLGEEVFVLVPLVGEGGVE